MNFEDFFKKNIKISQKNFLTLGGKKYTKKLNTIAKLVINCLQEKNKIIFCGNGGSAADSQHLAAEFVSKFLKKRKPYSAISLTTNTSILTSIANDFGYTEVFKKQIQALGKKGDLLFGISTSGKSLNVIKALAEAKKSGLHTVLLTGNQCPEYKFVDHLFKVPSSRVDRIQEMHIFIGHNICEVVEKEIN